MADIHNFYDEYMSMLKYHCIIGFFILSFFLILFFVMLFILFTFSIHALTKIKLLPVHVIVHSPVHSNFQLSLLRHREVFTL